MSHPVRPTVLPAYGRETAAAVLDIVENFPGLHNQNQWEEANGCKTTRCVAGWVQWLHEGRVNLSHVEEFAAHALGLDDVAADRLFYDTDNEQAAAVLRKVVAGQPIDWDDIWNNGTGERDLS